MKKLAQQADPKAWTQGELMTGASGPLQVSGRKAEEMGLVWKLIDSPEQLKEVYNLDHDLAPFRPVGPIS